ncbi:XdhC family protein [Arvimicrobium flavum]|uniref:XdhC family protein n=1 Tax=Arvimicrobium flavum TaxID=3393320 RepID=UPI00237BD22F|nr:XdhC family protein [Mesorhizobium shangrilense]
MRLADGSWDRFDDYVLGFAIERMRSGEKVAIVTLVEVEGSSPRPIGAQMAVSESGSWVGYLSGGCIERAVAAEAVAAIRADRNRRVRYGRGSRYIDISLPCGSAIELMFDVGRSREELEAIDRRLARRLPATMAVPLQASDPGTDANRASSLLRSYLPRRRLAVLGAGPVAVHLARLAPRSGFEVLLHSHDAATLEAVDATQAQTRHLTSPGSATVEADWRTAIALVFHDHDWESSLLPAALRTDAFYIGAMGSRETHRKRLAALRSMGLGAAQIGRIRGPAGLLPGVRSAADLALSILAEAVAAERAAEAPRTLDWMAPIPLPLEGG